MEHRDLASHVSALLVCWVSLHFNWSHTASSPANWKLQFRVFVHFSQTNMVFFPFSLFPLYPSPPPIFFFFSPLDAS